jgi:hypothetical protein
MKQTSKGRGNPSIRPSGRHDVFRPHPALFNPANIMVNGGVEVGDTQGMPLPGVCEHRRPDAGSRIRPVDHFLSGK